MNELWEKILLDVKETIPNQVFEAWIRPLRPAGPIQNGQLELLTRNDFTSDWVQSRYNLLLEETIGKLVGQTVRIRYRVATEIAEPASDPTPLPAPTNIRERVDIDPASDPNRKDPLITINNGPDNHYTFENFVVGSCNQFVHAAAERVAESPAAIYNPLFIYGGTGLGKTHILHAIANHVRQMRPEMRVLYTTSEKFMTQLINSIRYKRVFDFKENFRSVDMLMVDDIQFIAGKERTQEEFFHTFNALFDAKKQIVITSDQFPNEIEQLEERLRSRFGWGLVADIQPPDLETRIAILGKKASLERIELPTDVAFYLAHSVTTNVRELEGALIRVSAYASLTGQPITMATAKETLRDIIKGQEKPVSVEHIQKTVAAYYKIRPADMKSNKRSRLFSHPRQVAMYLCKHLTSSSYPEMGHQFGGRDHTTVLHAVRSIDTKKALDPVLAEDLESLTAMLRK